MVETHQRDPTAGRTNVLFEVWRLARLVGATLDEALAGSGLDATEFGLYSLLWTAPGRSLSELAQRSGTPLTTLSRRLRVLEARGHVQRRADPSDGRVQLLDLTDEGRRAHAGAGPAFQTALAQVRQRLGAAEGVAVAGLAALDRAVRMVAGLPPSPGPEADAAETTTLHLGGPPLSAAHQLEVEQFVAWLRHRDADPGPSADRPRGHPDTHSW